MPSPEVEWLPWQELMWVHKQEGQFSIALDQVEDNVTFTKRGVSFVSKASNRLGDGLEWMLEQMRRSETGRKMWAKDAWHARRVRRMSERSTHFWSCFCSLCTQREGSRPGGLRSLRAGTGMAFCRTGTSLSWMGRSCSSRNLAHYVVLLHLSASSISLGWGG